ncbi:phytoene/squalene synthase family protein [Sphingobacterium sp. UDSM-2020]|uniref:phytoene/squalene synthase family protein n=1 Tax=Sphingobacterium sp. UDSM-2020 TaxID=2795738 RepID=UPI001935C966|nr:phytoene/squalene synthase family protein [Sphingobacterium sp. UDSM-2020]QQD15543.1 phytoene/squalene synthase family protein [Sphingobacterium sp. UDSM-2020]
MKKLFDELAYEVSESITKKYSTSFSLGIMVLHPSIRKAIYAIYGYVRLADEIVDSFHDYDKCTLLTRFMEQTDQALEEGISLNPIMQSFQETVHRYGIDRSLIEQFLKSMEMDLNQVSYDEDRYKEYILGSAEVVGLMCLHVFVEGDQEVYEKLRPYAMKLGSAFQKINFLRDMKDDYHLLGRTYFPDVDMRVFDNTIKATIELDIENEFKEALLGIKKLPSSSKFGVFLAYKYYWSLLRRIKQIPAQRILNERIRIPNTQKLSLMMSSYVQYKIDLSRPFRIFGM